MGTNRWVMAGGLMGMLLAAGAHAADSGPVVVELFESQGCSSCPPAERVMETLHQEFGHGVLLLTFHVDYWDYLGWKDTFSDPRWTDRQRFYAQALNQDSIYTPEMVVQGQGGFVGSNLSRARHDVQQAQTSPRSALTVKAVREAGGVRVTAQASAQEARRFQRLLAVRVEDAAPVRVQRGENAGETMSGRFAVRALAEMPKPSAGQSSAVIPGTPAPGARIAVLALDDSGAIVAARETDAWE